MSGDGQASSSQEVDPLIPEHVFGQPRNPEPAHVSIVDRVVFNRFRKRISQNRCRFKYMGHDLDLAYITDRIIAMGYPSSSYEAFFRNSMEHTKDFLTRRHGIGKVKVFNLRGNYYYDPAHFSNNVITFEMTDHHPPRLELMAPFCREAAAWLLQDPENVIAVHCKAGKGRTGVMICALLIFLNFYRTPRQVLDYYSIIRTDNNKGVTIPSQRRYIYYYAKLRELNLNYFPVRMQLVAIVVERPPRTQTNGKYASRIKIKVANQLTLVFDPEVLNIEKDVYDQEELAWVDHTGYSEEDEQYDPAADEESSTNKYYCRSGYVLRVPQENPVFLEGDVRVDMLKVKKKHWPLKGDKHKKIGHVWFNTMFACKGGLSHESVRHGKSTNCHVSAQCKACVYCKSNVQREETHFEYGDKQWPYPVKQSADAPQETSIAQTVFASRDDRVFEYYTDDKHPTKPNIAPLQILEPLMYTAEEIKKTDDSQSFYRKYAMEEPRRENARSIYAAHEKGIVTDDYNIRHRNATRGTPIPMAPQESEQGTPQSVMRNQFEHVLTFPVYEIDRAYKDKKLSDHMKVHIVLRCVDSKKEKLMKKSEGFLRGTYKIAEECAQEKGQRIQGNFPFSTNEPHPDARGAEKLAHPAIRYADESGGYNGRPHSDLVEEDWDWRATDPRWCRYFYKQRRNSLSRYSEIQRCCLNPCTSFQVRRTDDPRSKEGEDPRPQEGEDPRPQEGDSGLESGQPGCSSEASTTESIDTAEKTAEKAKLKFKRPNPHTGELEVHSTGNDYEGPAEQYPDPEEQDPKPPKLQRDEEEDNVFSDEE